AARAVRDDLARRRARRVHGGRAHDRYVRRRPGRHRGERHRPDCSDRAGARRIGSGGQVKKKKSYTPRIIDAVDESDLPMPSKALLRVMAHHADHRTGVGWHGQETLARWVGCSLRTIQTLMAELSRSDSE